MDALTQAAHIAHESMLGHAYRQYMAAMEIGDPVQARAFWKVYAELHEKRPGCVVEEMERERGLTT